MTHGTGQGWFDWLPEWLPDWAAVIVLIVVGLFSALLFSESLRKKIADAASGLRWLKDLTADPKRTLVETVNPPVKSVLSPEEQAQLDRIEAKLDGRESGTPPDPEQRKRRDRAVRDIVADPDPDARAAADELASDQGDIDSAVLRLEHDARTATAEGAAKWRRIGDLVAGFDTTRALHAYEEAFRLQPDDFWTVVRLARQRQIAGHLMGALDAWEAARQVAGDDRERMIAFGEGSESMLEAGNLRGAAEAMHRTVELAEEVASSNPGSAQAQRDLSLSLERLGDLEERLGDIGRAIALYEPSLPIARVLAESNPSHPGFQKDLEITERPLEELRAKAGAE